MEWVNGSEFIGIILQSFVLNKVLEILQNGLLYPRDSSKYYL